MTVLSEGIKILFDFKKGNIKRFGPILVASWLLDTQPYCLNEWLFIWRIRGQMGIRRAKQFNFPFFKKYCFPTLSFVKLVFHVVLLHVIWSQPQQLCMLVSLLPNFSMHQQSCEHTIFTLGVDTITRGKKKHHWKINTFESFRKSYHIRWHSSFPGQWSKR